MYHICVFYEWSDNSANVPKHASI